ncbi:ribonuclease P protein component [Candidatus Gracilibacteria bacterium]|nr:ribonuclease P protein component [Candidatus Gracilibacteria bacterium]
MIAKKYRIPSNRIALIKAKGGESLTQLFIVRHMDSKEEYSRYCVIVSLKISKKAVERNQLKRQTFEAIRTLIKEKGELKNIKDLIFIPKKQILNKNFQEIKDDINQFLWKN